MNKIVRHRYPVSKLPEELREGLDLDANVTVTIDEAELPPERVMSLEEIFVMADQFRNRTGKEIDEEIRAQRDEWDD